MVCSECGKDKDTDGNSFWVGSYFSCADCNGNKPRRNALFVTVTVGKTETTSAHVADIKSRRLERDDPSKGAVSRSRGRVYVV